MRFRFALLALALTTPLSATADEKAITLPERKAGLWELKTIMDEGNGPRDHTFKICVDAEMEKNTVAASLADHKANCTKYDIKSDNGTIVTDGECTYSSRLVVSRTEMTGDFKSKFEIKISSTTSDPSAKEKSIVVKRTITQTGTYVNESCGELKGGEAMGPDGAKHMIQ